MVNDEKILINWYGVIIGEQNKTIDMLSDEKYESLSELYNMEVAGVFPEAKFARIVNTDNKLIGYGAIFQCKDKTFVASNRYSAFKIFIEDMFYRFRKQCQVNFYRDRTGDFLKEMETIVNVDRYSYLEPIQK